MLKRNTQGFTLVELLVVITILAIISVVAYQNFGGAVDKAVSGRKISDLGTIETALQQFKTDKNFYPMPINYSSTTNMWGYNSGATASPSNNIKVTYSGQEIASIVSASGGGKVFGSGAYATLQIGAKGVVGYNGDFAKKYLSKDLYDPEIGDTLVGGTKKMIDSGIGRYVYAVYALPKTPASWNISSASASYYNIATSVKQKDGEKYESYILGDFTADSCGTNSGLCPSTLIGTLSGATVGVLVNAQIQDATKTTLDSNQGIPYPITDFSN